MRGSGAWVSVLTDIFVCWRVTLSCPMRVGAAVVQRVALLRQRVFFY